jgi:inorganic triphosphatase YgiF
VTAEIEIKLAIDPGVTATAAVALFRHPAVAAIRRGRVRKARVVSTYFDTPDWRLAGAGIALRLRRDGTRWLQTVKGPPLAQAGGALHVRGEYEWPIAGPRLDPVRLATTPWRRQLGDALAGGHLASRFTTDFERRTLGLTFSDGTRAKLCLDQGAIRAAGASSRGQHHTLRTPIAEIEIELESGSTARLFELAATLTAALPLTAATTNKAARGQALAQGRPDGWHQPVRAKPVALAVEASAPEALRAIAVECLHQVAANAPGLAKDDDPEWIHQMRVGTRRLRSCLGLLGRLVPADRLPPLLAEIKWLAGILGHARDWDVFATETVPAAAERCAADPAAVASFDRFSARVGQQREAARAAARDAIRSPRFQQLVLAVGALCALPDFGVAASADPDAKAPLRASAFARKLLRRHHRRLVRRAEACTGGGPGERHALRIAAKKLRYAAEFFAPLRDGNRARGYVHALAALQDVLGRGNDAVTAARLASEIAASGDDRAAAALDEWLAATAAAREPEFVHAWKRFARTKRFWKKS